MRNNYNMHGGSIVSTATRATFEEAIPLLRENCWRERSPRKCSISRFFSSVSLLSSFIKTRSHERTTTSTFPSLLLSRHRGTNFSCLNFRGIYYLYGLVISVATDLLSSCAKVYAWKFRNPVVAST